MIKSTIKKILSVFILLVILCSCLNHNYSNWKEVEIPTHTPLRGKIKIPNEWEFTTEDGIITLINQEENNIIAKQIYQEWYYTAFVPGSGVDDWTDLEFKSNIDDVDFKNQDYYDSVRINSSGAHVYSFNDGVNERLCIFIRIYSDLSNPYYNPKTGSTFSDFELGLMFNKFVEFETIQQMAVSYSWGGRIN